MYNDERFVLYVEFIALWFQSTVEFQTTVELLVLSSHRCYDTKLQQILT